MSIQFICLTCKKTLKAPDEKAGAKVSCPGCKAILQIPFPQAEESDGNEEVKTAVTPVTPNKTFWFIFGGVAAIFLVFCGCPLIFIGLIGFGTKVVESEIGSGNQPDLVGDLVIKDIKEGTGPSAKRGDKLIVHYSGKLRNGKVFDSSRPRGEPFPVTLGRGKVIPGWEQGLLGMKVGGVRELIIPPDLAYGKRGSPPTIPPNSQLHFEVELLDIE